MFRRRKRATEDVRSPPKSPACPVSWCRTCYACTFGESPQVQTRQGLHHASRNALARRGAVLNEGWKLLVTRRASECHPEGPVGVTARDVFGQRSAAASGRGLPCTQCFGAESFGESPMSTGLLLRCVNVTATGGNCDGGRATHRQKHPQRAGNTTGGKAAHRVNQPHRAGNTTGDKATHRENHPHRAGNTTGGEAAHRENRPQRAGNTAGAKPHTARNHPPRSGKYNGGRSHTPRKPSATEREIQRGAKPHTARNIRRWAGIQRGARPHTARNVRMVRELKGKQRSCLPGWPISEHPGRCRASWDRGGTCDSHFSRGARQGPGLDFPIL
jgi:hypothetical protein